MDRSDSLYMNIPQPIHTPVDAHSAKIHTPSRAQSNSSRQRRSHRIPGGFPEEDEANQSFLTEKQSQVPGFDPETPEAGGVYLIRQMGTNRTLTLTTGRVTVHYGTLPQGGWQWLCEDLKNGHMAFREAVSGRYLGRCIGHTLRPRFHVEEKKAGNSESWALRPRKQGGYNLMVKRRRGLQTLTIVEKDDTSELKLRMVKNHSEAVRWEFIKVA
ncbi:hypothetical protein NPX13_g6759 [Xylaria arbuscula]|uniref:Ricin B lectin domain-containing protein n=1 Tax=Xylaria arbuscula TaxID=114810 RepID=A0A9W8NBY8_9PEZI|nr:hypothetical protein NPX13_g6759 [Xylaria arbuscula]